MTGPVIIIAGPTAVGKSAYALDYATAQNGVIINADALQRYDALPILTAQPNADDRARVPHILYGTEHPGHTGHVKDWMDAATAAIQTAWTNNQTPIVVGGTGLYLKSLTRGLPAMPDIPDDIRNDARALQNKRGNPDFHHELAKIDPVMAGRLNPNDSQRLIRAYEVMAATGVSLDEWQQAPPIKPLPDAQFTSILIDGNREVLRTRALTRLHQMIEHGVLDEVAGFAARITSGALAADCAPTIALGYRPFLDHLNGNITRAEAITAAHIQTAQYIKRQQTWLRHQMKFDETLSINSA
jgi:tRNA dimethylallyltransferase